MPGISNRVPREVSGWASCSPDPPTGGGWTHVPREVRGWGSRIRPAPAPAAPLDLDFKPERVRLTANKKVLSRLELSSSELRAETDLRGQQGDAPPPTLADLAKGCE